MSKEKLEQFMNQIARIAEFWGFPAVSRGKVMLLIAAILILLMSGWLFLRYSHLFVDPPYKCVDKHRYICTSESYYYDLARKDKRMDEAMAQSCARNIRPKESCQCTTVQCQRRLKMCRERQDCPD